MDNLLSKIINIPNRIMGFGQEKRRRINDPTSELSTLEGILTIIQGPPKEGEIRRGQIISPLANKQQPRPDVQTARDMASPTPTPTPIPTPTPPVTKFDDDILDIFGDDSDDARRVLKRTNANGATVGENTSLMADASLDFKNTDGTIDRGLFRINSGTFEDFINRKGDLLANRGITNWDDMLDPRKNIEMARVIFNEQGWDAWVAAPESLLSEKEKERRKKLGIQIIE